MDNGTGWKGGGGGGSGGQGQQGSVGVLVKIVGRGNKCLWLL